MNDTTIYIIVSAMSALGLATFKLLYSSNCKSVNCCFDSIQVERDIQTELLEDTNNIQSNNLLEDTNNIQSNNN